MASYIYPFILFSCWLFLLFFIWPHIIDDLKLVIFIYSWSRLKEKQTWIGLICLWLVADANKIKWSSQWISRCKKQWIDWLIYLFFFKCGAAYNQMNDEKIKSINEWAGYYNSTLYTWT